MATFIVVEGLKPYDGRYELDWNFTTRQYGWVKRMAGLDVDDMVEKIENGKADAELATVWALIALHQAGKVEARDVPDLWERMIDDPFGAKLTLEAEADVEQEDEAGPPEQSSTLNDGTSSQGSSRNSETLRQETLDASGTPDSDTSESEPLRSVS
jgi:hypothetical protein